MRTAATQGFLKTVGTSKFDSVSEIAVLSLLLTQLVNSASHGRLQEEVKCTLFSSTLKVLTVPLPSGVGSFESPLITYDRQFGTIVALVIVHLGA